MKIDSIPLYWFLLRTFRNGPALIQTIRHGGLLPNKATIDEAIFWNGGKLTHPAERSGLVGIIVELLFKNAYRIGAFYTPKADDMVVDLGAHVGIFSHHLLSKYDCRVVAVEPCEENFVCLKKNLEDFSPNRYQLHKMAIGGAAGKVRVETPPSTNRTHDARVVPANDKNPESVDMISLNDIFSLARTDQISLLKVDIEGSEFDAFNGLDDSALPRLQKIAMEYHDNLHPGTLDLLKQKLGTTHQLTVVSDRPRGDYGMLFAELK